MESNRLVFPAHCVAPWQVIVLGTMAHPNIVELVGVSCDDGNRCLM